MSGFVYAGSFFTSLLSWSAAAGLRWESAFVFFLAWSGRGAGAWIWCSTSTIFFVPVILCVVQMRVVTRDIYPGLA